MAANPFFEEAQEASKVKAQIVSKYFPVWAKIIIGGVKKSGGTKIGYLDLFAGPGRYEDGTPSTPLLVLEKAIGDRDIRQMLLSIFRDKNGQAVQQLRDEIENLPNVGRLKYKPDIDAEETGDEIVSILKEMSIIPSLVFLDPWGYRGLSLDLINSVLKDWGCECIFFFNYNRINMAISNPVPGVAGHVDALFGKERANNLRKSVPGKRPYEREEFVISQLMEALKEVYGKYVQWFRFKNQAGTRTTHYLIFVTKHPLGYKIMKGIMAKASSTFPQRVPSFEYNPTAASMLMLERPLDELKAALLDEFSGRRIKMGEVFQVHNVGKRYIKPNYKEALAQLEQEGKIRAIPPAKKRRLRGGKRTFGDDVLVIFP